MDLVNCVNDRNVVMERDEKDLIEILKQFGKVVDYMTEHQVAIFYKVTQKTIENHGTRNKEELSKYGYRVYKKSEILNTQCEGLENIPNRGLRLYPVKAVIVLGMILTESEIAEQLRENIMDRLFSTRTVTLTKEEELALQVFHGGLDAIGACKELNKINYDKGFLEGVKNERMSQLITTSSLCKLIKVSGLTSQIFYRFLNFRNLGNLKRVKKNYKFVPNEKFNEVMVVNGWAKSISTTSTQVRFYSDLADIINDNAMYLQQLEDIKYYYVDLLKAGDDEDADLPF